MNNERGLTLVEILAVIVILSIVIAILMRIFITSANEQVKQVELNKNITDHSYALKVITKDFRKAKAYDGSDVNEGKFEITLAETQSDVKEIHYELSDHIVKRMEIGETGQIMATENIASGVKSFLICENPIEQQNDSIDSVYKCPVLNETAGIFYVLIQSNSGQIIETEITIRGGS